MKSTTSCTIAAARTKRKSKMYNIKTWNARDQPKEELVKLLEKKYKEIESSYKLIKKVSDINQAKKIIDEIWMMKSFANTIEMELMRRNVNGIS